MTWTAGLMEGLRGGAQVCGRLTGTWCFAGWRRRVWCRFLPRSERRVRRQRSAASESRTARLRNTVTWQTFNKKLRLKRVIPDKLRLRQLKVNRFTECQRCSSGFYSRSCVVSAKAETAQWLWPMFTLFELYVPSRVSFYTNSFYKEIQMIETVLRTKQRQCDGSARSHCKNMGKAFLCTYSK